MAENGQQKNPTGAGPYQVRFDNNFSDLPLEGQTTAQQQQCRSFEDAWKAITAIKPTAPGQRSVVTAQSVHDVLAFILSRLTDNYVRESALYIPGRMPDSSIPTSVEGVGHHSHWAMDSAGSVRLDGGAVEQGGFSINPSAGARSSIAAHPAYGGNSTPFTGEHSHTIDPGAVQNRLPFWWQGFDHPLPLNCFIRHRQDSMNLKMTFHVPQGSIATMIAGTTTPAEVATAIDNVLKADQFRAWVGGFYSLAQFGNYGQGNPALVSDRFNLGVAGNWSTSYERHLAFWVYKAFFTGLINMDPDYPATHQLTYAVNPFGIMYWPGNTDEFSSSMPDQSWEDLARRWLGTDGGFDFDLFVASQLWPAASDLQKIANLEAYINALHLLNGTWDENPPDIDVFSDDPRVEESDCRVGLGIGYTLEYTGTPV